MIQRVLFFLPYFYYTCPSPSTDVSLVDTMLSQVKTMCSLSVGESVCCCFLLFVSILLICVKFLFSVWDTHFTFGGCVVGCSVH